MPSSLALLWCWWGRSKEPGLPIPPGSGMWQSSMVANDPIPLQSGWCQQRLWGRPGLSDSHLKLDSFPYQLEGRQLEGERWLERRELEKQFL